MPAADSAFLAQASGFNLAVVAELVVDFFLDVKKQNQKNKPPPQTTKNKQHVQERSSWWNVATISHLEKELGMCDATKSC